MRRHPILLVCATLLFATAASAQVRIKSKPRTWGTKTTEQKQQQGKQQKTPARNSRQSRNDAYRVRWAKEVLAFWAQIDRVSLTVDPSFKDNRFSWLKSGEDQHNFKIVRVGGKVDYAKVAPTSDHDVKALFKRTSPGYQIMELGFNHQRMHAWVWIRMSFIAEDKQWVKGDGTAHRFRNEDKLYRKWFQRVVMGPDLKASSCSSLERSIIRGLSSVKTSRESIAKLRSGRTRAIGSSRKKTIATRANTLAIQEKNLARDRERLRRTLLAAGERLGVGDALLNCAEQRFRLFEAEDNRRVAEGMMRSYASRLRKKPDLAGEFSHAKAKWQRLTRKVAALRRERRASMATVTGGVRRLAAAPPR